MVFGPLETWRVGVKSSVSKYKRDFLNQPLRLESREKWNREKNHIHLKEREMRVEGLLRLRVSRSKPLKRDFV